MYYTSKAAGKRFQCKLDYNYGGKRISNANNFKEITSGSEVFIGRKLPKKLLVNYL